jgi:hypothetical protein
VCSCHFNQRKVLPTRKWSLNTVSNWAHCN